MIAARRAGALLCLLALVLPVRPAGAAEWHEDYLDGVRAIEEQRFDDGLRLVQAAMARSPKAAAKKRTYGVRFIEYLPEYYLGLAYLGRGDRARAAEWLERAEKDGEVLRTGQAAAFRHALEKARAPAPRPAEPARSPPPEATAPPPSPRPTEAVAPPPRPSPTARPGYLSEVAAAERAVEARRIEEALAGYERARAADPEAYEQQGLDRRVAELSRQVLAAGKLLDQAQSLIRAGRLGEAQDRVEQAERLAGPGARSEELRAELRRRRDDSGRQRPPVETPTPSPLPAATPPAAATPPPVMTPPAATPLVTPADRAELRVALQALFGGDTPAAVARLEALVRGAGQADADAHGYLGVAYASLALTVTDASQGERFRRQALEQFGVALRLRPEFGFPERLVSPRIRSLLDQARANP